MDRNYFYFFSALPRWNWSGFTTPGRTVRLCRHRMDLQMLFSLFFVLFLFFSPHFFLSVLGFCFWFSVFGSIYSFAYFLFFFLLSPHRYFRPGLEKKGGGLGERGMDTASSGGEGGGLCFFVSFRLFFLLYHYICTYGFFLVVFCLISSHSSFLSNTLGKFESCGSF